MTSTVVKTVKSSGGDYSSLSAWEAGQQGDLTVSDTIQQADCYSFQDTTAVVIDGWTTSATQYVYVRTPSTERHDGKWNTAKYYLTGNNGGTAMLWVIEEYTRLEGLQVQNTGGLSVNLGAGSPSDQRITESIVRTSAKAGPGIQCSNTSRVQNCVVYDASYGIYVASGTTSVFNTTIVTCNYGILNFATTVAKNVYVGNCSAVEFYNGPTLTTCANSSATSYSGSTANVAFSTANFVNVTSGSEDLHLVSGSALKDAGTDLSATFTTDIDGQTRTGTWDIGADEYVVAAPAGGLFIPASLCIGAGGPFFGTPFNMG